MNKHGIEELYEKERGVVTSPMMEYMKQSMERLAVFQNVLR
ncbi:hypothetical protein DFQ00_13227 [Paenibacillus barcinonensis]|uniref:Uncharacterized protein n=1 Tax=Paenibacillus barcinonensis TaxID=198119 RepID=A0A2V4V9Y0_PAEBA|nr:hypothetical protein [Paenibacillus barcinonensis]PYE42791.1 hypothetical protein DFQ00_13227 [Paenibacillus barcinonensis]